MLSKVDDHSPFSFLAMCSPTRSLTPPASSAPCQVPSMPACAHAAPASANPQAIGFHMTRFSPSPVLMSSNKRLYSDEALMTTVLFIALGFITVSFLVFWGMEVRRHTDA